MAMTPEEALALAEKEQQAVLDADMAAQEEKTNREMDDKLETDALAESQKAELGALGQYNQAQYNNVGDIISEIETKQAEAKQKDAQANKRSNAFRYIASLGDTLSGMANLIGTAHGATNQKQTYNGNIVAEKAEQARKERKIELDSLSKRLDEMKARQRDMQAAGSLAEAQLKAKQDREIFQLQSQQRAKAEEAKRYADAQADKARKDVFDNSYKERTLAEEQRQFDEGQKEKARQFDAEQKRLEEQNEARLQSDEKIAQAKLDAAAAERAEKRAADPEFMSKTLQLNATGIRDEIARNAGYDDYNDYLQHKKGNKAEGKTRKETRQTRKAINRSNPEDMQLLELLESPEYLTEEQVRMLAGASSVFADAVNGRKTAAKKAAEDTNL